MGEAQPFSPIFSLAVFCTAPQLTECLKEATRHMILSMQQEERAEIQPIRTQQLPDFIP